MPGANFYIVTEGWKNNSYTSATYNGYDCFQFTKDSTTIYVKKTAFYPSSASGASYDKSGRYPASDSVISTNVTNYLNTGDSSFYYSGRWHIYNADGLAYVQLGVYGTQAFKYEADEVALQHKVITSAGANALNYTGFPKSPTLKLSITNTGSGQRYFGGYFIKGLGDNTSTTDIGPMIELGYKTYKLAASLAVPSLSFGTVKTLYDYAVSLNKTGITTKTYLSDTIALSNIAKNIYSYSCSLKCPFSLASNGAYFQAHVGLNGADGTSLKYDVTFIN